MGGILMGGERIPRGVLAPPQIGFIRVPLDILPFLLLFVAGFLFGISVGTLLVFLAILAIMAGMLRKKGDGFLRGWVLWLIAPKHRIWGPAVRKKGGGFDGNI